MSRYYPVKGVQVTAAIRPACNIIMRTLNLTMRHICKPTFSPAPFHACSVSAAAFFTCRTRTSHDDTRAIRRCQSLTFRSRSEPNSARLLSFQSYFFALTKPAIANCKTRTNRCAKCTDSARLRLLRELRTGWVWSSHDTHWVGQL